MWGKKNTNINRHKKFDPLNVTNLIEQEQREAKEKERRQALRARDEELEKQRMQRKYDTLMAQDGKESKRRVDWMYEGSSSAGPAGGPSDAQSQPTAARGAGAASKEPSGAAAVAAGPKGKVTKEEAAEIKRRLDRQAKVREDPMSAMVAKEEDRARQLLDPLRQRSIVESAKEAPSPQNTTTGTKQPRSRFGPSMGGGAVGVKRERE